ncbi:MAG: ribonuclease H-like domain-containing protein [Caldicoprobacterales bacterium]|jgi:uncharacterized protein YprB with RNaseH-like and TPR domain|nr:ribonuclease H-like domain-containing protein [Bacillota bacterium]
MISNLKAKLRTISSNSPSSSKTGPIQGELDRGDLGGSIIEGASGSFVLKTTSYSLATSYGDVCLDRLKSLDLSDSQWWTRLDQDIDTRDIVFLDTETTGLAGGTGTLAFLVGIGYLKGDRLVVRQYLARDFDEELPMLEAVTKELSNFKILVTFNGKSFDWPLLESRLVYSRLRPIAWEDSHLDLLYIARRLWGRKLKTCSLTSLEENVLSHYRTGDIPGYMVPEIYRAYLETRRPTDMLAVMDHNQSDILAMAALLIHIGGLFKDPIKSCDPWELFGVARDLERSLRLDQACDCYKYCIKGAKDSNLQLQAKKQLAYLLKRYKGPEAALGLWRLMADEESGQLIFPLIEMAKYLEHREKDFDTALLYTKRALEILDKGLAGYSARIKDDLIKRKNRLLKKKKGRERNGTYRRIV